METSNGKPPSQSIQSWTRDELPPEHVKVVLKCWKVKQFSLPTEVVVTETRIVTPRQGRMWPLDYYDDGKLVSYQELCKKPRFEGTGHYKQAWLVEKWENDGDDGHVDFRLMGYVLTVEPKEFIRKMREHYEGWYD